MCFLTNPKHIKGLLLAAKDKRTTIKIHALMIKTNLSTYRNFMGRVIASYASNYDIVSARKLFEELPQRGVDTFNAMIIAYSRKESPFEVLGLYNRMIKDGVKPDSSTFTVALKACVGLMDMEMGEEIWRKAVDFGYENDVFVGSSMLNLYAKCGKMYEATAVFDKMKRKDLVCWSSMINGFAVNRQPCEAVEIYRRMQKEGIEGDEVVIVGLIQACANLGDSRLWLSVHGYAIKRDLDFDVKVQTSLVDMYAKNGHLDLASHVFKKMSHKNVVSWGALISGFAQNGLVGSTLETLVEMQSCGFEPDSVSLMSALLSCAQIGLLKLGKSIHGYILRRFDFDQVLGTAVIDMYSKCGAPSCARAIFDQMESRDLISWNVIIASYGIHGHGKEALSLFLQMIETKQMPDHSTFASLLWALSHSGLVEEGQYWFDLMVSKYKIQPSEKHYACMVDLLARAGRVEEALQLIDSMNTEPGLAVWVALLSGCHNNGKLSVGEMVAKKVLELNPDDSGIHALVSNFFAMKEKWDEVAGVRKTMRNMRIKKVPGYSAVEVNGELHAFIMEDKSHHQFEDILNILKKLDREMRAIRCLPNTELCMV
ncbi:Pentatricopeptide repeat-containing protein [Melia azedarach]|uniref:Pentatricopeptide repeat-containing protein n=1 Tax=Melia azedarach TaxID=155640 RepID=A0ACC1YZ66_MELAZ|nr:Pentatricopeptide repeat-containing protein [Melia azedarach]